MKKFLGHILFDTAAQHRFADAAGDWNPLHLDALAARRLPLGAPVVHGMHSVLASLDLLSQQGAAPAIEKISAAFPKPAYAGERVDFYMAMQTDKQTRLEAEVNGVTILTLDLLHGAMPAAPKFDGAAVSRAKPLEQSFDQIDASRGETKQIALPGAAPALFPAATQWLGQSRVAALAALSAIVGMQCPGLHSIFTGFEVALVDMAPQSNIDFTIKKTDDRFRKVTLEVTGGGLQGSLTALVRLPPVVQPSLAEIAARVPPQIFIGQHALVIGGSRGLGEYAAKIIVAGGGHVTLTYATGLVEAEAVQAEIKAFGGNAEIRAYDVRQPAAPQLADLKNVPTHLYYFATGSIFRHHRPDFDSGLFDEFYRFYVTGFYTLCQALAEKAPHLSTFYPSSTAVETRPRGMTEYAMAKAAGEIMCADLPKLVPGLQVNMQRLPRLATDQTATVLPVETPDTLEVLLPILREMAYPEGFEPPT